MNNFFMPVQASEWAARIDFINWLITVISIFCTVAITVVMLYFAIKHRRRSEADETPYITHNTRLETVWTVIPTIIVIAIFYYGFVVYREMRTPPANALEISVVGQKWNWSFEHPNGKRVADELVVPVGTPVRLIMRSRDVIHSLFIPAMRIKEDVVGSIYTYQWFTAIKTGDFDIFCAEYCGDGHWRMRATLKVVSKEQYDDYVIDRAIGQQSDRPPSEIGKGLFANFGCKGCHTVDGSPLVGPTLKGVFGHEVELADGSKVVADETYVRQSILEPNAKVVKGFQAGLMPPPAGATEDQVDHLIAYIKSLGTQGQ